MNEVIVVSFVSVPCTMAFAIHQCTLLKSFSNFEIN